MKYYLDTEFHEYHKQLKVVGIKVGKPIPTVDLISIGIVSEDYKKELPAFVDGRETISKFNNSREYYDICKEFNIKDAWNSYQMEINKSFPLGPEYNKVYWLRENVLKPIWEELSLKYNASAYKFNRMGLPGHAKIEPLPFTLKVFKKLINKYGKTKKQVAEEILDFSSNGYFDKTGFDLEAKKKYELYDKFKPEFYAYYADYDWVVFCQLFGKMMDLPKGFPMYCKDLKQILDEKDVYLNKVADRDKHRAGQLRYAKTHPDYPKQENEHNALDDAKWNKKLHEFLNTL